MGIESKSEYTCDLCGRKTSHLDHAFLFAEDRGQPFATANEWIYPCDDCWPKAKKLVKQALKGFSRA